MELYQINTGNYPKILWLRVKKPEASEYLESMEISTDPSITDSHINEQQQGNLKRDCERKFE